MHEYKLQFLIRGNSLIYVSVMYIYKSELAENVLNNVIMVFGSI